MRAFSLIIPPIAFFAALNILQETAGGFMAGFLTICAMLAGFFSYKIRPTQWPLAHMVSSSALILTFVGIFAVTDGLSFVTLSLIAFMLMLAIDNLQEFRELTFEQLNERILEMDRKGAIMIFLAVMAIIPYLLRFTPSIFQLVTMLVWVTIMLIFIILGIRSLLEEDVIHISS